MAKGFDEILAAPRTARADIYFRDGKVTLPILLAFARGNDEERSFWRRTLEDMDQCPADLEHATTRHPHMTAKQWREVYERAWHQYYNPRHVTTLLRRAEACGAGATRVAGAIHTYRFSCRGIPVTRTAMSSFV